MAEVDLFQGVLPYHRDLADYFEREEPELWAWFGSAQARAQAADAARLELLKHTYRLEPGSHPELFAAVEQAKAALGVTAPVTVYQAQAGLGRNLMLYYLPGEAHVVLQGDVLELLNGAELAAVIGHELAHFALWEGAGGRHLVTSDIAHALVQDRRAAPSHAASHRLLTLYTEIFADRGSLAAAGDLSAAVGGLVKIHTGMAQVDPAAYLRQADEIFSRESVETEGVTHPEAFVRARALRLWSEAAPDRDAETRRMIEGRCGMDRLDLLAQEKLTAQTRRWLDLLVRADWMRTDSVRAHARLFFPDFEFAASTPDDPELLADLRGASDSVRDYYCYVMLDFASVDPELELEPLRAALTLADELGWGERLEALAVKELKVRKRETQQLRGNGGGGA